MVFCNRLLIHHPSYDCSFPFVYTVEHTFAGHKVSRLLLWIIHLTPSVWFVYLYPVAGQSRWSALCHCFRRSTNCYWFLRSVRGKRFHPLSVSTSLFSAPRYRSISMLLLESASTHLWPHFIITGHLNVPPLIYWYIIICGQVWSKTNTLNW